MSKSATRHVEIMKGLHKRLLKEGRPAAAKKVDPLKALVRGAMTFDVPDALAEEAMRQIDREFVDLNELRVATELEVQELLGVRYPEIEKRVGMITQALNAIFEKEHTLSLDRLASLSKRDIRQFLRGLGELHPFVEAYVMLYAFEAPAAPLDQRMLAYLRQQGAVDERLSLEEAQRFVEHHLRADEMHDFFVLARRAAHEGSGPARKTQGQSRR